MDFGTGDITPGGDADIFVVGYTETGEFDWVTTFGHDSDNFFTDAPLDLAVTDRGHVATTGVVMGPADLGGGTLPSVEGGFTLYHASFNANDGAHRWSRTLVNSEGSGDGTMGFSVATTPSGLVAASGFYTGTVMFGSDTFPAPAGAFVVVYGP